MDSLKQLLKEYGITECSPLNKGWSRDKKYILSTADGRRSLLRISDISLFEKKQEQFDLLQKLDTLNISCSKPIAFGRLNDEQVYMTLSYLEGQAADEIVSALDDRTAYSLGVEAGKTLKLLHGIPVQTPKQSWWEKYSAKIPKKIERIRSCELSLPQREMLIGYIEEHIALVKNRRQVFSHSDYHVGNMIVNGGKVSIIDFDKNTISDPYDEFKPFCWNVFANEYFETGLINGYFGSNIPDDFFPVLALYAAESLISHLPWAITFGQQEIETAYRVIDSTLRWYDNFTLTVPTWYKGILEF